MSSKNKDNTSSFFPKYVHAFASLPRLLRWLEPPAGLARSLRTALPLTAECHTAAGLRDTLYQAESTPSVLSRPGLVFLGLWDSVTYSCVLLT